MRKFFSTLYGYIYVNICIYVNSISVVLVGIEGQVLGLAIFLTYTGAVVDQTLPGD